MKLNIYKNQKEVERTLEVNNYDLMYGTVEDILAIVGEAVDFETDDQYIKLIVKNLPLLKNLLKDIFIEEKLSDGDLRKIKVIELVPLFFDLMNYVKNSFGTSEKN